MMNRTELKKTDGKKLIIKMVGGLARTKPVHRATMQSLGLRRINAQVECLSTAAVRGMITQVNYLIHVKVA